MNERKHQDYIYLKENYYSTPKETFKFNFQKIKDTLGTESTGQGISILDFGCAKGEWLYYVKKQLPMARLVGVDYSPALIEFARNFEGLSDVDFHVGSIEEIRLNEQFDFIRVGGVLSYFDDLCPSFATIKEHMKKSGRAYIFDQFNPYDIDVHVRYRNNQYSSKFESGWNISSLKTVERILDDQGLKIRNITKFILPFKLEKSEDPARTWTLETEEGTKFVNGLGQIFDMELYEIGFKR